MVLVVPKGLQNLRSDGSEPAPSSGTVLGAAVVAHDRLAAGNAPQAVIQWLCEDGWTAEFADWLAMVVDCAQAPDGVVFEARQAALGAIAANAGDQVNASSAVVDTPKRTGDTEKVVATPPIVRYVPALAVLVVLGMGAWSLMASRSRPDTPVSVPGTSASTSTGVVDTAIELTRRSQTGLFEPAEPITWSYATGDIKRDMEVVWHLISGQCEKDPVYYADEMTARYQSYFRDNSQHAFYGTDAWNRPTYSFSTASITAEQQDPGTTKVSVQFVDRGNSRNNLTRVFTVKNHQIDGIDFD
jgi:hypothetical protein